MAIFGPSELVLHVFVSVFTALAIWASYRLFRRFVPDHALFLCAALVVGPGFLINQNVMVDIPVFSMMVVCVLILTGPTDSARAGGAGFGLFAAALLSKYSAVFLFPALLWASLARWRVLIWAVLPVLALVGWSLFNIYDFGAVHLLNRPANEGGIVPSPKLTFALLANLGVFAAPVAAMLMIASPRRLFWIVAWAVGFAVFYPATLVVLKAEAEPLMAVNAALFASSLVVGLAAFVRSFQVLGGLLQRGDVTSWYRETRGEVTMILWFAGGAVFLATFPPFMATRHALLLSVPLFILATSGRKLELSKTMAGAILLPWAFVGVYATGNDIAFARFYRDSAPLAGTLAREFSAPGAKVFSRGHWGWQWYASEAGMETYDSARTRITPGDILVDPVGISAQALKNTERFEVLKTIAQRPSIWTLLDTHRFYASGALAAPVFAVGAPREIRVLRATR